MTIFTSPLVSGLSKESIVYWSSKFGAMTGHFYLQVFFSLNFRDNTIFWNQLGQFCIGCFPLLKGGWRRKVIASNWNGTGLVVSTWACYLPSSSLVLLICERGVIFICRVCSRVQLKDLAWILAVDKDSVPPGFPVTHSGVNFSATVNVTLQNNCF